MALARQIPRYVLATVLIAPVGLYWRRVLNSIRTCKPQEIYLLLATKNQKWPKKTKENVDRLKAALGGLYDEDAIKIRKAHFGSFADVFRKVDTIIRLAHRRYAMKGNQVDFWLDITSAPTLPRMAIVNISALYANTHVHYTPTRNPTDPYSDYRLDKVENDTGSAPVEIPIVRSNAYSQIQRKKHFRELLDCLLKRRRNSVGSQSELMGLLGLSASSRKDYMMIGRVVNELEGLGIVSTIRVERAREKRIRLTLLGVAIAGTMPKSKPKLEAKT